MTHFTSLRWLTIATLVLAACGGETSDGNTAAGAAGTSTSGTAGSTSGSAGSAGSSAGTAGSSSGTSGTGGAAGTSGANGTAGSTSGTSGTSGVSGAAGTAGTAGGTSGTAGIAGNAGTSGTAGSTSGTAGIGGTGGIAGTSGTAGISGGSSSCSSGDTCVLIDDCCNCMAIGPNDPAPACNVPECFVLTCESQGIYPTEASCVAGQCILNIDCNQANAGCASIPPVCPDGQVPSIHDNCYGGCVSANQCTSAPSCDDCHELGMACVGDEGEGFGGLHCVPIPASCNGTPSCACMSDACTGAFQLCIDPGPGPGPGSPDLTCECPTCDF